MAVQGLSEKLEAHKKWLRGEPDGARLDLSGEDLLGENFRGLDLRWAKFSRACMRNTGFSNADLRGADFQGAELQHTDLQWADLREANFWHANLQGADLQGAKLDGARLDWADICGAKAYDPLWSFSLGQDTAIATKHVLCVGHMSHPWDVWLRRGRQILKKGGYQPQAISEHMAVIRTMYKLLQKRG